MDEGYAAGIDRQDDIAIEANGEAAAKAAQEAADKFLGRWIRLVSTTNWEKGRIIFEWREALLDAGAPAQDATDEVWSRLVGNVTPQHVGRLRRVYQRFNDTRVDYPGLFWSHFQAVIDWDDAEMWLEGAVQNGWSIAQMQVERSRTMGSLASPAADPPDDFDEDAQQPDRSPEASGTPPAAATMAEVRGPDDFVTESANIHIDSSAGEALAAPFDSDDHGDQHAAVDEPSPFRPFERLPELPDDLRDAVEGLKLVIVQYRLSNWRDTRREDVLLALDALRDLTLAPL